MLPKFGHVTLVLLAVVLYIEPVAARQLTVKSFLVRSHIRYRFSTTEVASTVINDDATASHEAVFEVLLPEEAFISNFSMTVDEEVYVGRVEEKQKALTSYQQAKSRGESAGYIKTTARHSNKFDVSVNLKPGSSVTFNLTYQQVLPRHKGMYEQRIHLNPGQLVPEVKVEVFIEDSRVITTAETEFPDEENSSVMREMTVSTTSPSPKSRYIVFKPSLDQQKGLGKKGINRKMLIKYDVDRDHSAGEVLVVDGYFIHFFAPENAGDDITTVPKDILFVLDISGSMSGTKIEQLKEAMTVILKELSKNDRFNIFLFDDRLKKWKSSLVPVESRTIGEALDYVSRLRAEDSTDLNMALTRGVSFMLEGRNKEHTSLMFFLTDGQPTVGVKDPASIAKNVERLNEDVVSLFGLAFGDGADYDMLKVVSAQNCGFARRIYEAADAADQVEGFYDEISTTVFRDLKIKYINGTVDPDSLTTTTFRNVFLGNDVVVAGRMTDTINTIIGGVLTAETGGKKLQIVLDNNSIMPIAPLTDNTFFTLPMDLSSVIERSWAYLRIKSLLLQKRKDEYKKEKTGLDQKITELALKYNFVTPLTSMVATKPEQEATKTNIRGDDYKQANPTPIPNQAYYPQRVNRYNSMMSRRTFKTVASGVQPQPQVSYFLGNGGHSGAMYSGDPVLRKRHFPSRTRGSSVRRLKARHPVLYDTDIIPAGLGAVRVGPAPTFPPRIPPATHLLIALTRTVPTTASTASTVPTTVRMTDRKTGKRQRKNQRRRPYKKNMRCKLGKMLLDGFGTTANKQMCSRAVRVQPGTFQIFPAPTMNATESNIYVQATIKRGSSKPFLHEINILLKDAGMSFTVILNTSNTTSMVWRTPDTPSGYVAIHKQAKCRPRQGVARYFIMVHLTQPAGDGSGIRKKRDIKRKIRRTLKKKNLTARVCRGSTRVEKLNSRSKRLKRAGNAFQNARVINL
ncbi:inter-alpha-trypsin inhibitor heavy chain H3-like isoform X3 [Haliotis asinina]|uniref:inter-alpha-trypsin inhibitor heavy chain H3-like isoform X3 n=1 Tax=Haliotis asinina TaxID=109174 RepID=UPI0035321347